jgi:hypothetical protein
MADSTKIRVDRTKFLWVLLGPVLFVALCIPLALHKYGDARDWPQALALALGIGVLLVLWNCVRLVLKLIWWRFDGWRARLRAVPADQPQRLQSAPSKR